MIIQLKKINKDNWQSALKLEISQDHKSFVAPNLYSIAEAQFYPDMHVYGIYNNQVMVGLTMYGTSKYPENDKIDERCWIWRLMIGQNHRQKGYGRQALKLIIEDIKSQGLDVLLLSTEPENIKAISLYKSLGFLPTGIVEDGEEEYILTFTKEKTNETL
ncbi:MAG: spermidine acetyltransferase [Candidatus Cloacimonadota bacterium]|nr:MAG: spermidine acetyltransferase [Candidatus Cloacimonadota bacterium]PCJ16119.1 MAG: spermidine acetyltransferase [Candidatus Cloacimonadota bacterium]